MVLTQHLVLVWELLFGGAFSAGAFKYSLSGQGKNSLKNLEDIHNYGFDELRGGRLFYDLTQTKKGKGAFSDGKVYIKIKRKMRLMR